MSKALDVIAKVEVEMNLTTMIDVTFLLLIYFMITSKFKTSEGIIQAFLPKDKGLGTSSPKAVEETRVKLLWHDKSGKSTKADDGVCVLKVGNRKFTQVYYQGDRAYSPDFASLREFLKIAAADWQKSAPAGSDLAKGIPVIIDARNEVPFRFIVRALNSCLEAGVKNVTFAAASNPID